MILLSRSAPGRLGCTDSISCERGPVGALADSNQADLPEECEVIFEMPIVRDLSVAHSENVRGDEIDRLPFTPDPFEDSRKMTAEAQMRDDAIADDDALNDRDTKVGHRRMKCLVRHGRAGRPLRATRRQCVIDEPRRKRGRKQPRTSIHPEAIKCVDRLQQ